MVLPLQKLIHIHSNSDSDSDSPIEQKQSRSSRLKRKTRKKRGTSFKSLLSRSIGSSQSDRDPPKPLDSSADVHDPVVGFVKAHMAPSTKAPMLHVRTLQRYHGGPNEERIQFMEKHSALASKNLGVGVEQVSVFLTSDNSVISFFESSAEDIETPIVARLSTRETILRRSSDASMLVQVGFIISAMNED